MFDASSGVGHMNKWKVLFVVGGIVIIAFIVIVVWLYPFVSQDVNTTNEFFAALFAADYDKLRHMVDPKLADNIDEPLLVLFATSCEEWFGRFHGVSAKHFRSVRKIGSSTVPVKISCMLKFEKGTVNAKMEILEGKVISYLIHSERIPKGWTPIPADTRYWREKGKEFLAAYSGDRAEEAFRMMHPDLQKIMPLERLRKHTAFALEKAGRLLSVEFLSEEKVHPSGKVIALRYELRYENLTREVRLRYGFQGLKGYLIAVAPVGKLKRTDTRDSDGDTGKRKAAPSKDKGGDNNI